MVQETLTTAVSAMVQETRSGLAAPSRHRHHKVVALFGRIVLGLVTRLLSIQNVLEVLGDESREILMKQRRTLFADLLAAGAVGHIVQPLKQQKNKKKPTTQNQAPGVSPSDPVDAGDFFRQIIIPKYDI